MYHLTTVAGRLAGNVVQLNVLDRAKSTSWEPTLFKVMLVDGTAIYIIEIIMFISENYIKENGTINIPYIG